MWEELGSYVAAWIAQTGDEDACSTKIAATSMMIVNSVWRVVEAGSKHGLALPERSSEQAVNGFSST